MSKTIKNVLISQPAPADLEKSQYKILIDKHNLNLTFYKFFNVVGISNKEFRDSKVSILDHSAVIMTSKLAIDNYFRLAKELRLAIPETMKYFCITESVANYLQNYIQYRKRKIFYGKLQFHELMDVILKHKEETYLFPCAEDTGVDNFKLLEKNKIKATKSVMYRSETRELNDEVDINKHDMVVMFSPIGVKSFTESFPKSTHDDIVFAAFGASTQAALKEAKIKTLIPAPTVTAPSMVMAIDKFLSLSTKEMKEYLENIEVESEKKTEKKPASGLKVTAKKKAASTKKETATKNKEKSK